MLLDEFIKVKIINHNINHYINLGYNVKYGDIIKVKPEELSKGSHYIVNCKCDNCDSEKKLKYQDYNIVFTKNNKYVCEKCRIEIFNNYNSTKKDLMKNNRLKSINKKYGVDNVFQLSEIKEKIEKTNIIKYGVPHRRQNMYIIEKEKLDRIRNGKQIPDEQLSEYILYKKKVHFYTRKCIKELYENWNGVDYYDNEIIINNKNIYNSNNINYPTVDHKVSIKNGFNNNISAYDIGKIENLCITKRCYNSSKGSLYDKPKNIKIKNED